MTQIAPLPLGDYAATWRPRVDDLLGEAIGSGEPAVLYEAMRYAALGPGKRLRPLLVLAACEACGADPAGALPAAAAIEMVHAFSLVHDDLPCMDDDDFRRGRPTCHKAYGEAVALLAGDGLLARALGYLAEQPVTWAAEAVAELAEAVSAGMIRGQVLDIAPGPGTDVELLHHLKTGRLFVSACALGAIAAGASAEQAADVAGYGMYLGLAFQIADDIKDAGEVGRETYVTRFGVAGARQRCLEALANAEAVLAGLGPQRARALAGIAGFVRESVAEDS
ncbi:MAG: polyprenyl synthetase family protein [Candidatus Sericytochromatia bacterium]|nr:polyprenyl synthetase family protein [Candidatus Tanganyikabacteria bacterium]